MYISKIMSKHEYQMQIHVIIVNLWKADDILFRLFPAMSLFIRYGRLRMTHRLCAFTHSYTKGGDYITPIKEKALAALLDNNTMTDAANAAGISRKTLYNYLNNDEEFKKRYNEGVTHLVSDATLMLKKSFTPCIERLQRIVRSDHVQPAVQVQACRAVLDYGLKMIEIHDIEKRLNEFEKMMEERQ